MDNPSYPTSDEIESDQARRLFEYCAFLIIENLPIGSEFGIDMAVHRVGDKFKGLKLIPPGLHFVYASPIGKFDKNNPSTSSCGPRCGFYHNFAPRELLVRKWSIQEEEFEDAKRVDPEVIERYRSNLYNLDPYLGSYSYSSYQTYLNMISKLTPEVVRALSPTSEIIRSVPYLINSTPIDSSSHSIRRRVTTNRPTEETLMQHFKTDETTVIKFTRIPETHLDSREKIDPELITKYNLDTTLKLNNSFGDCPEGRDRLLAELQFSFVTFLLCHVYDCFEHWKILLTLLCLARDGLASYPELFEQFIDVLMTQVDQIPGDMFEDIVDSNNLVRTMLDTFFENLDELTAGKEGCELKRKALVLKEHLKERFNWQFNLEVDEEQPVVVDLD